MNGILCRGGWGHAATWLRINCLITTRRCVSNCDDSIQAGWGWWRGVGARHHRNCFTGPPEATWGEAAPALELETKAIRRFAKVSIVSYSYIADSPL